MLKKLIPLSLVVVFLITIYASDVREYKIDTNHSTIGFSAPILNGLSSVTGKFSDFSIDLQNDENDTTKSSVKVVIKTASISTGIAARDNHLRTADFFAADQFPEITFVSTEIKKKGKSFLAVGNLTMHGVTKQIELPFSIKGVYKKDDQTNIGYEARMVLNRRDFGINWENPNSPSFVGDNVEVEINLITKAIKN
jgi:polyisoprenoid-binding protein YceI